MVKFDGKENQFTINKDINCRYENYNVRVCRIFAAADYEPAGVAGTV
jgi:hypothetical protein